MATGNAIDVSLLDVDHPLDGLERDAQALLDLLDLDLVELSLVLCDDTHMQALNRDYRGVDGPTDVLSFSQLEGEAPEWEADAGPRPLGDVVISLDTAARQAKEQGHDLDAEIRVLLVHGLLHLLGHDHEDDDEAALMRAREQDLLARLAPDSRASLLAREHP